MRRTHPDRPGCDTRRSPSDDLLGNEGAAFTHHGVMQPPTTRPAAITNEADRSRRDTALRRFAGVTFMDSTGINALVIMDRQSKQGGGSLVVATPSPAVLRLLDYTGAGAVLNVDEQPTG